MNKVLIDRELLERAVYGLELAYETDTPTVRDICAVLAAPSGTPAMPAKAYYHEAPNEYGGLNKSVGLEVRKAFTDAPLVLESDALARIACLEGEIAKRDARIVELESQYQRDVYGLNNEGDPIGGDPAGGYANDNARLRAELSAIKAQEPVGWYTEDHLDDKSATTYSKELADRWVAKGWPVFPLYAAPVSEAKAQGVVMPRNIEKSFLEWASAQLQAPTQLASYMAGADEVARLNATPVQQVSVPDGFVLAKETVVEMPDGSKELGYTTIGRVGIFNSAEEVFDAIRELDLPLGWVSMTTEQLLPGWMLTAAPAAPAADAGVNDHD